MAGKRDLCHEALDTISTVLAFAYVVEQSRKEPEETKYKQ